MADPERAREIVLPRSGVALTLDPEGTGAYLLQIGGDWPIQFRPSRGDLGAKAWVYSDNWYEPAANGDAGALSWLDARVLSLRSALGFDAAIRAEREKAIRECIVVCRDRESDLLILAKSALSMPDEGAEHRAIKREAYSAHTLAESLEALLAPPPAGEKEDNDGRGRTGGRGTVRRDVDCPRGRDRVAARSGGSASMSDAYECPNCGQPVENEMECDFGADDAPGAQCKQDATHYCTGCECWRCADHDCACEPSPPAPPAAACETCGGEKTVHVDGYCGPCGTDDHWRPCPACAKGAAS